MIRWIHTPEKFSKRSTRLFMTGLALVIAQSVYASSSPQSVSFSHKDWDLVCDNTLTCRATGYSANDVKHKRKRKHRHAATVLLIREAGPSTPITNRVMLADYYGETASKNPGVPILRIEAQIVGKLLMVDGDTWQMSNAQFAVFMQALRYGSEISFSDNVNRYFFSGVGSSEVLQGMDDVQGRVGTIGALMKKGSDDESDVNMPVPMPVIVKIPVRDKQSRAMTSQEIALIKPELLKSLIRNNKDDENGCDRGWLENPWHIAGLNDKQSLVSALCWRSAYVISEAYKVYVVISNDMSSPPIIVTNEATSYDDGVIEVAHKGRNLGDCWSHEAWVWNGKSFIQSDIRKTGRCRLIRDGGAWNIPTLTTKVITN